MLITIGITILGIILTILLIVGIHEFGHFMVAKCLGVKVLKFSIGFGKALVKWHDKSGTEYAFSAIPLGGYVKMLDEGEGHVAPTELPLAYNRQKIWKRFLIVAAGPLTNFILALVLYWIIFVTGFINPVPITGEIIPHSIAAQAGMQKNQEIISIDQQPVMSWMSIILRLLPHTGNHDKISIQTRDIHQHTNYTYLLNLTDWKMDELKPDPLLSLGIVPYQPTTPYPLLRNIQYGPIEACSHAWQNTYDFTYMNLLMIGKLFTGKVSIQSLGGPIAIFQGAGSALNQGIASFLSFLAFLSIAIGVVNILPIPGLDGGHILFQLIEAIMKKPISAPMIELFYKLGFILLLLLITQAVMNDILRL